MNEISPLVSIEIELKQLQMFYKDLKEMSKESIEKEFDEQIQKLRDKTDALRADYSIVWADLKTKQERRLSNHIHKECEWYSKERDSCHNYMMGKYTGLAFDVSRHDKCIKDMVKE